jgi:hypothetical protein
MNKRRAIVLAAVLLAGLVIATGALAQGTAAIERWALGSAGGESTGAGDVALNSTLGEPIIGPSSGGSVSLGAGYWHGGAVDYRIHLPLVLRGY